MYQMEQYGAMDRFPINHIQPFFKINDKTEGGRGRGRGRGGDTDYEDDHGISSSMSDGVILSTDPKPRLRWTSQLHQRFVDAITQLGGADKATPKSVMRLMNVKGLTLYHLKSHLQKYRLGKQSNKDMVEADMPKFGDKSTSESHRSVTGRLDSIPIQDSPENAQITEAIGLQMEVERKLHEQLEVQRLLQVRIEAQGRYLQSILEKAQLTLARQNDSATELEPECPESSDQTTKVSAMDCSGSNYSRSLLPAMGDGTFEDRGIGHPPERSECSPQSCLTHLASNERSDTNGSNDEACLNYKRPRLFNVEEYEDAEVGQNMDEEGLQLNQSNGSRSYGRLLDVNAKDREIGLHWGFDNYRVVDPYMLKEEEGKGGFRSFESIDKPVPHFHREHSVKPTEIGAYRDRISNHTAIYRLKKDLDLNAIGDGSTFQHREFI